MSKSIYLIQLGGWEREENMALGAKFKCQLDLCLFLSSCPWHLITLGSDSRSSSLAQVLLKGRNLSGSSTPSS